MGPGALDLPAAFLEHLEAQGVDELYPPQIAAVEAGVTDGVSLVAALPTASGKTLIAQLAMMTAEGPALYVVPLRALAAEKHREFEALPGVSVGIATGDYDADATELGEHDVVVATSEKVDSLVRHGTTWLRDVACLVVDEAHLLDDSARGPTLEMTIARLRRLVPGLQIVALSATVANPDAIAEWLDAELVESDWRPIELREAVYRNGRLTYADGTETAVWATRADPAAALVEETLEDGGQALVFVHSRRAAEALAAELGGIGPAAPAELTEAAAAAAETETGRRLVERLERGAGFHHAGLRPEHRRLIEEGFRDRAFGVLVATPTLAAGINVPARRVVVRDYRRYTDEGRVALPVLEVRQMMGRAGRPGLDPHGEAVLIAQDDDEADALLARYLEGEPEPVTSKLATQEALRIHVLATVASGFADSREALLDVLGETLYAAREDRSTLVDIADLVLDDLVDADMLRRPSRDALVATSLGELVSQLYVDPRTAVDLVGNLEELADRTEGVSTLTALELICDTPDMGTFRVHGDEEAELMRTATVRAGELRVDVHRDFEDTDEGRFRAWLRALKTARALSAVADGDPLDEITDTYGIGPGDVRSKVERAEWLLGAARSLAEHDGIEAPIVTAIAETEAKLTDRSL